jgi:hypothetical protein
VTIQYQPSRQVCTPHGANRYCALVSIAVDLNAAYRTARNECVKVVCSFLPTTIFALIISAKLIGLRSVDSPEAYTRPVGFQSVAVDDRGLADKIICTERRSGQHKQNSGG